MSNDLISVVIPVFNLEFCIKQTLNSVSSQTYRDIEIIVVDDGSSDSSVQIVRQCQKKDPRIMLFSQRNQGALKARLKGLHHASGVWICFVDGDDHVDPEMCAKMLELSRTSEAQIIVMMEKMVYPNGNTMLLSGPLKTETYNKEEGLQVLLTGQEMEPGLTGKMYKSTLFNNSIIRECLNMDVKVNEDLFLNYLLFKCADRIVNDNTIVYSYLLRQGSATQQKSDNVYYDPIKIFSYISEDCLDNSVLWDIVQERLIRHYLYMVRQKEHPMARIEGKKALGELLNNSDLRFVTNSQLRFQLKLFRVSPDLFVLFRRVFDKVTGRDRVYDAAKNSA